MKKIIILLSVLLLATPIIAHPWKPKHYVIVDTDGANDDLRALALLLASPDVRVLAVTVTEGSMTSDSAYSRISMLLKGFNHEGMYAGKEMKENPATEIPSSVKSNMEILGRVLGHEEAGITLVCLGGMRNAMEVLNIPGYKGKIKQIVWSGDIKNKSDFNYNIDRKAADFVINSGIPVKMIGDWNGEFYDAAFMDRLAQCRGIYSDFISASLNKEKQNGSDEMVPLCIHYPELFTSSGENHVIPNHDKQADIQTAYIKIATGETVERNQVIRQMPTEPSFYFADLEPYVNRVITAYGMDEWSSGVLANELHRHLGTFAIIGVKMGIRAREYFNTGVDEFAVLSLAGSTPPMSCLNDGLQVSTGATPGHGLLRVEDKGIPSAEIRYKDRHIRISLKPEIADTISAELKRINFIYGLDSDIYWELVRKNTIWYWLDLDRHDIFIIEEL